MMLVDLATVNNVIKNINIIFDFFARQIDI